MISIRESVGEASWTAADALASAFSFPLSLSYLSTRQLPAPRSSNSDAATGYDHYRTGQFFKGQALERCCSKSNVRAPALFVRSQQDDARMAPGWISA